MERCVTPRSVYGAQGDRLFTQKNRLSLTKSRLLSSKPTNEPLRNKPGAGVFEPEPEPVVSLLDTDTVREQDDKVLTGGTRKRQAADPVQAIIRDRIKVRNGATVAIELISAALKLMNEDEVHGHGLTKKEKILERQRLERVNKTYASVLLEASQIMLLTR
ncbi:uncharacterized protein LOC103468927 isoform X2 [Poecilia reticulata]|nr:PREDICTED: uncharacterized protein LOC103468927 isoform X2 [Poecilia reticulata]